jgi:hypothetical protein
MDFFKKPMFFGRLIREPTGFSNKSNEGAIKNELKELVRTSVEETFNGLLDREAEINRGGKI